MRKALAALGVIAVLAITSGVLWMAGEQHYRSCIQAAEARWPVMPTSKGDQGFFSQSDPLDLLSRRHGRKRTQAISDCSRLPL